MNDEDEQLLVWLLVWCGLKGESCSSFCRRLVLIQWLDLSTCDQPKDDYCVFEWLMFNVSYMMIRSDIYFVKRIIKFKVCTILTVWFLFVNHQKWFSVVFMNRSSAITESTLHSRPLPSSSLLPSSLLSLPRRLPVQHLVCRPLGTSADDLQEPVKISIPRHVLRGQGKDEHFEFEVKVSFLSRVHLFITSLVIYVFLPLHLLICRLLHHPSLWRVVCFFIHLLLRCY